MRRSCLITCIMLAFTMALSAQSIGIGIGAMVEEEETSLTEEHLIPLSHPAFPGCADKNLSEDEQLACTVEKMNTFFKTYMHYPKKAMKSKLEGGVLVSYIVKADGTIGEVKILEDIGKGCGDEAKRLVELMNKLNVKWNPATENAEVIETQVIAEVPFNIN